MCQKQLRITELDPIVLRASFNSKANAVTEIKLKKKRKTIAW